MKKSRFLIGLAVVLGLVAGSANLSAKEPEKKKKKEKTAATAEAAPAAATPKDAAVVEYHGNTESKKFHPPCSKDYNCKNCTAIFKSKEEAVKAGYTEVKCQEKKAK